MGIELYAHLWALSAAGGLRPGVHAGLTDHFLSYILPFYQKAHSWAFSLVWLEPLF